VDVGNGSGGLFEVEDWFKIEVNAEGCIDGWRENDDVRIRYNYKEANAEGVIRTDVIYAAPALYTPVSEPVLYGFGVRGYFVDFDETGQGFTPFMGVWGGQEKPAGNEITCEGDIYYFSGCNDGDWWSLFEEDVSAYLTTAGWALFEFYAGLLEEPDWTKEKFAEGTRYWHPDWPYWALHVGPWLVIDFIDKDLP
jgi:hypothetical protein